MQCRNILEKNLGENDAMLAEYIIIHGAHGFFTGHFFNRFQNVRFL